MRIFRLFFPILMGLAIASEQAAYAQDKIEKTLSSFGYIIKQSYSVQPDAKEKEQYQTLARRVIKIKSEKAVPRMSNTFYRFTVIEDQYADAGSAKTSLSQRGAPLVGGEPDALWKLLCTKFQYGKNVYFVTTDAGIFSDEMKRIAKALETSLR